MQCWINIHMASWGQVKVLYRRADYQSPRPLGQTSIFIYIVRFFYIRKAFYRNEISFSSFNRLKIFSGKKYFYSVSGVYITAVKLARKLVNFLKGENLLNFWHSFVTGLKVLVFKKQSLYFMMIFAILAWIFITKNAFDHNENTNKQVLLSKIWYKRSQSSNDPGCRHTYKESSEEGGQYFPRHGDRYGKR